MLVLTANPNNRDVFIVYHGGEELRIVVYRTSSGPQVKLAFDNKNFRVLREKLVK